MPADEGGTLDLIVEDPRWQESGLQATAERAARAALAGAGLAPEACKVSLLAADDGRIAALNAEFRGKAAATNVLSWPVRASAPGEEPPPGERRFLGDLALAYDTCAREAEEQGIALEDHAAHLVVHGVLHLLGYDHEDETAALAMEALETKILASLGVADPYSR